MQRHNPLSVWDAMDQFFSDSWNPLLPMRGQFVPSVDVSETNDHIKVVADVPGYDPENLNVSLENTVLTIQGTMEQKKEEKEEQWHCKQCACGSFVRQFTLPDSVKEQDIACKAKNGKLTVTIKKKGKPKAESKKIVIDIE